MTHHRARGRPARSSELCDEPSWNQYRRLVRVRLRVRFKELHNLHDPSNKSLMHVPHRPAHTPQ